MATLPDLENRNSGVVSAFAECSDCDWRTEARTNALANASLHARRTGHEVHAEQVVAAIYNQHDDSDSTDG